MKKLNIYLIAILGLLVLNSCEDENKNPLPQPIDGSFVTLDLDNLLFDITQTSTTAVTGVLKAPVNNVASYDLTVKWTSAVSGESSEFIPIYNTQSFPHDMNVTLVSIADGLELTLADFNAGDRFDFVATSTSNSGSVTNFNNLNIDLQGEPGQAQSYKFTSYISCPVDVSLIPGTYTVKALGFNNFFNEPPIGTGTRTVVAGPGANQFTIVEGEFPATGGSDPLIIDFDPSTGIITGGGLDENDDPALAWQAGTNGLIENSYIVRDGGFIFSCIGFIDLKMNFNPFNANPHSFVLEKN